MPDAGGRDHLLRRAVAEALGTAGLVFAAAGAVIVDGVTGGGIGHLGVSLTAGMAVAAMIYSTGHVSGAHINPAVTLGFALSRDFPWREAPVYWAAQLAGAAAAGGGHLLLFGRVGNMGATLPSGSDVQSLGMEAALTFILMFVIMAVATDVRAVGHAAALAIGMTVALESTFAGPVSGASMNPARSFGPALAGWVWSSHWVYWAGPMLGAAGGALTYRWLRGGHHSAGGG